MILLLICLLGFLKLKLILNICQMLLLQLKDKLGAMREEEQLKLLATDGMLVKRPLLVDENRMLAGFREAEWEEQLL